MDNDATGILYNMGDKMKRFTLHYVVLYLAACIALCGATMIWTALCYECFAKEQAYSLGVLGLFTLVVGVGIFFKETMQVKARYREEGTIPSNTFKLIRYDNMVLATRKNKAYKLDKKQVERFELGLPIKTATYYDKNKNKLNKYFIF